MLMKNSGVTLLEIMLVLAIAAMIIVMSVRYYQATSNAQQANAFLAQMQTIAAAADQLAEGTHSYKGITDDNLKSLLGQKGLTMPWGYELKVGGSAENYITFYLGIPNGICQLVISPLQASKRWRTDRGADLTQSNCAAFAAEAKTPSKTSPTVTAAVALYR